MKTYTQTFVGLLIILFFSSCSSWLPTTDSVSGGDGGADDATTGDNLIPVSMTMSSQTTQAIASAIPQISAALPAALPALKAIKKASTVEKVILACLFIPKSIDELLAKKDCILAYDEMSADDFLKGGKFGFSVCRDIKFDLCGLGGLLSDGSAQVWVELPTKNFKPKDDFDFGEITFKDGGFKVSEAVLSEITTLESENENEEDFDIPNFQGAYTIAISTSGANITASTVLKSNEQAKNAKEETAVTLCPNGELAKKGSVTIIDGEIFEGVYVVPEEKRVTIVTEETNPTLVKGCDEIVTTKAVIICDDSDCKKSSGFLKQLTKLDGKTCKNKTNEYNVVSNAFTATKAGADCLLTARTAATGATGGAAASTESQSFSITIPNSYGYIGSSWSSIESSKLGGYIEQVIGKNPETAPVSLLITMNADKTEASYSIKGSEVSGTVKLSGDQYGLYGSDSKSIKTGLYQIYLWSYFDYVTKANKLSGDLELTNADALYVLEDSDDFMTYSMFAEDQAKTEEYNTYAYSYTYSNDYAVPEAEAQATAQTLTSDLCSSYPSGNISDFSQAMQNEINALSLFLPENSKYLLTLEIVSSEVFIATFTTSDGRSIVLDQDDFDDVSYYSYNGGWSLSAWRNIYLDSSNDGSSDGSCYVSFYASVSSYNGKEEFWPSYSVNCSSYEDWNDYYYRYLTSDSYSCATAQQTTTTATYTDSTSYNSTTYYGYDSHEEAQNDFNSQGSEGTYKARIEAYAYSYNYNGGGDCSSYTGTYEVEVKKDATEAAVRMKKPDGVEVFYSLPCTKSYGYENCSYYVYSPVYDSVYFTPPHSDQYYSSDAYFSYYTEINSCGISVYGSMVKQ